jgi:hypothetical protein
MVYSDLISVPWCENCRRAVKPDFSGNGFWSGRLLASGKVLERPVNQALHPKHKHSVQPAVDAIDPAPRAHDEVERQGLWWPTGPLGLPGKRRRCLGRPAMMRGLLVCVG